VEVRRGKLGGLEGQRAEHVERVALLELERMLIAEEEHDEEQLGKLSLAKDQGYQKRYCS